jgi:Flp pilus assembly protein TadG
MRFRKSVSKRKGAALVESALVLPVLILLILGIIIVGLGVFRYQQMATLAREGARWASVHGGQYALDTGKPAATASDVYNTAILPMTVGLNLSNLSYSVSWPKGNMPALADPNSTPPGQPVGTTVVVTVSYNWIPEAYFGGVTLTSTSTMPMEY